MTDLALTRIGAVALVLGLLLLLVAEPMHPAREDPMDNPAVFAEHAQRDAWTAVHLGEYAAFLLLLGAV